MGVIKFSVRLPELKAAMVEKGVYTQLELCQATGLSTIAIFELFNKPNQGKKPKTCLAICKALGKELNELFVIE